MRGANKLPAERARAVRNARVPTRNAPQGVHRLRQKVIFSFASVFAGNPVVVTPWLSLEKRDTARVMPDYFFSALQCQAPGEVEATSNGKRDALTIIRVAAVQIMEWPGTKRVELSFVT